MFFLAAVLMHNYRKKQGSKKFSNDFNKMALSIGLKRNDINEIKTLLTNAGITKPYLVFLDSSVLEKLIGRNMERVEKLNISQKEKEKRLLYLFEIKRKIYNHYVDMRSGIKNTLEIEANQLLSLKISNLGSYYSILIMNDKRNLICSIPEIANPMSVHWKDKVVEIYFWRYNDAGYVFKSRIENVVYSEKLQALVIAHSDKLKRIQRREYPRRKARFNTKFFKFSVSTNNDGKPVVLLSRLHFGIIIDISPGGASVITEDPLPKNSAVKMQFGVEDETLTVYGTVLNVIKKKNMFVMHVKIQRLNDKSKNQIYRYVYNYI